jgi:hypothetical protein
MSYIKTDWKARQGKNLNKFTKTNETGSTVILENTPDAITVPGTPFSVENMNKIEQGIYDAHDKIAVIENAVITIETTIEKTNSKIEEHDNDPQAHGIILEALEQNRTDIEQLSSEVIKREEMGVPNGVASLDGEGRVPLDQLPEILTGDINIQESYILNKLFPIGSSYIQGINDPDPVEKGLPGQWSIWTGRAEAYRLTSSALPAFTTYASGANYAAGGYVSWHLPSAGYELFKAKAAITNATAQLNPVLWEKYVLGDIIERRYLQGWLDDDFEIGHVIEEGDYAGMVVCEVIARGGTFPSYEGGNRPTFVSGGVAGDMIRELAGAWNTIVDHRFPAVGVFVSSSTGTLLFGSNPATETDQRRNSNLRFKASDYAPTGTENSNRTLSDRFWRRVA